MAAPVWNSYAVRPFGFAGAATFLSWVLPGSTLAADAITDAQALVSLNPISGPTDPTAVVVPLQLTQNGQTFQQDLPAGLCHVAFFAKTSGAGWVAGPTMQVDFSSAWTAQVDYVKPWVTSTLQRLVSENPPPGLALGASLDVRSSHPKDSIPIPCLSVGFEASPFDVPLLGDSAGASGPNGSILRTGWHVTITIIMWTAQPEDRDVLAPWLMGAMKVLARLAPFNGLETPTYHISEAEDFSGSLYQEPLFNSVCTLTGTTWARLDVPDHNFTGHLTI